MNFLVMRLDLVKVFIFFIFLINFNIYFVIKYFKILKWCKNWILIFIVVFVFVVKNGYYEVIFFWIILCNIFIKDL